MVRLSIELLIDDPGVLPGQQVGLITNSSGVTRDLTSTIDLLHDCSEVTLDRLFAPEHGIRGNIQADVDVEQTVDEKTGLPVYSLHREKDAYLGEKISDLDVLIYDMQDIGCRFYARISTLARALEAASAAEKPIIVLDRPNPISPVEISGNLAPPPGVFAANGYKLPIVHGMTVGELATYFNEAYGIGADLTVLEMENWRRDEWFDETDLPWVLPSPNMPTLSTAILYPGTCLFEATNLSEGRGTTKPFELVGAPWLDADEWATALNECDLPGVGFRPAYFKPMFSKHERKDIEGVQVHILDRDSIEPMAVGVTMLASVFAWYPDAEWLETENGYFIDQLAGGEYLRKTLSDADPEIRPDRIYEGISEYWEAEESEFEAVVEDYALY